MTYKVVNDMQYINQRWSSLEKEKAVIYACVSTTKDEQKSSLEIQEGSLSNIKQSIRKIHLLSRYIKLNMK